VDLLSLVLEAAPKAAVYAAVMLCVGASTARLLLRIRVSPAVVDDHDIARFQDGLARLLFGATWLLLGALAVRAWSHTAVSFGMAEAFDWNNLRTIAWESRWGEAWTRQIGGAVILFLLARSIPRTPSFGWTATALGSVAICYLLPLLGHAAGEPDRVALHGSHVLGGGIWLGTLAAVLRASASIPTLRVATLQRFSVVAFSGASLLVMTGAVAVWMYVPSFRALVESTYGRLIILKLVFVTDTATLGFLNWRAFKRDESARMTVVLLEVASAVAIVLVTALLTESEHP
jgi:putative copper export protein